MVSTGLIQAVWPGNLTCDLKKDHAVRLLITRQKSKPISHGRDITKIMAVSMVITTIAIRSTPSQACLVHWYLSAGKYGWCHM